MTPKEARQKVCPMMTGRNPVDGNFGGVENCWANQCAVWEVDQTKETVYKEVQLEGEGKEEQPEGEGWEKVALHKETDSQISSYRWTRTLPIEDQPGQCGLITKYLG